ncbi:Y-family DNA polymerase [Vagococcus xieshaowenii]|uniref:Y-family DNA polymerase n=1 Tax=Vagococcus xieshaowenii TaxID=2562451 RepID=A0AAJ5EGG3_9ENTE|nr:Y-family DNA polymerase [Vagococcus xieshaowenii]TFZ42934.1 Y-family DNA polymerase [Vagococcus xieshaowenii]
MSYFNYEEEPLKDIFLIDAKSFYASCECVARGLHPLKTMLVVASTADNTGSGLVLAASPLAKKKLGISNVTRLNKVPKHKDLLMVPPRMNYYIDVNIKINNIFRQYVADEDLLVYSIDESILDVTKSLNLFFPDKNMSRREKRWRLARRIQLEVKNATGIYLTVGIGDNPLLAKIALDNYSKHSKSFIDEIRYEDVEEKIWTISPMTDFWGIGERTKENLRKLNIWSIKELANADPVKLKMKFGILGLQLFHHANGIDRTILSEPAPKTREKSYGNSQVLPRDYHKQEEIEVVIKEMAEQVASRIRRQGCKTACVRLSIGFSFSEFEKGFSKQLAVPLTSSTKVLQSHLLKLFRENYEGQVVRHIGVTYSKLTHTNSLQLNLFESPTLTIKNERIDTIIDKIRDKYGFTSIVRATSLSEGSRSIARASLVGGHAGGHDGL